MVGGVTPGKGGQTVEGLPVFDTVEQAVAETGASATMIFVPAPFTADAILEAADAGIEVIAAVTEGVPVMDMIHVFETVKEKGITLIGPNCPGLITPEECKMGIMPGYIHQKGKVGVMSRSGTLTYEAVWQTSNLGLGQSTCVGLGGDPIVGTSFIDLLKLYEADDQTEAILMIGENAAESHPISMQHILHAKEVNSAKFMVIDPRFTKTAAFANIYVRHRSGTDVAFIYGLINIILANGWEDKQFLNDRTYNFEKFHALVKKYTPEVVSDITGVSVAELNRVAKTMADNRPGTVIWAMGGTQHTNGTSNTRAYCYLQLVLGGRAGAPGTRSQVSGVGCPILR